MKRLISVTLSFIIMLTSGIIINAVEAENNLQAENTFSVNPSSYMNEDEDEIVKEEKKICKATIEDDFADDVVIVMLNNKTSLLLKDYHAKDFKQIDVECIKNLTPYSLNRIRKEYNKSFEINKSMISKNANFKELSEGELNKIAHEAAYKEIEKNHIDFHETIAIYLKEKGKKNVIKAIKQLEKLNYVLCADPAFPMKLCQVPNDTKYDKQWAPGNMNLESAWNITTGSANVKVGVIDTGIASSHTDISPNIDTTLSHSFVDNAPLTDTDGHGTSVAGVIGAKGNNSKGVAGVCWNVKLVSLKAQDPYYQYSYIFSEIDYARNNNIEIINLSSSVNPSNTLYLTIKNYPGLFVCAAGNDGQNIDSDDCTSTEIYPSKFNCSNIISVASINANNNLSSFSNYGTTSVDIAAPGEQICVAKISNTYGYSSGTSFAAPHVAGVAALIKSKYSDISYQGIKAAILNNATAVSSLNNKVKTGGKINARAALDGVLNHHFTVKYNKNGGNGTTMSDTTVTYGRPKNLRSNTYTKNGYVFKGWTVHRQSDNKWYYVKNNHRGWYEEYSEPEGATKVVLEDEAELRHESSVMNDILTLYAVWKKKIFFISYNDSVNQNYPTMPTQTVLMDYSANLSPSTYTYYGYRFSGWYANRHSDNTWLYTNGTTQHWYLENQQPSGYSKKLFCDQETVLNLSVVHEDTVTMYAQWEPNYYYLYYYEDPHGSLQNSVLHQSNDLFVLGDSACSINGSIIIGWNLTDNNGKWLTPNSEWTNSFDATDNFILPNKEINILSATNNKHYYAIAKWAPATTLLGDVNLDGYVTNSDVTTLMLYLNNMLSLSNLQMYTADYNQNGIIDNDDLLALQLFLNPND